MPRRSPASAAWTSSSRAGSPTAPPPSPYQLRCRTRARSSATRRASRVDATLLGGLEQPELGEVAGHLCVGRGTHRRDPADQRPGAFGPLEGEARPAVVEGQPQTLQGQVAAVPDQGALQVEAAEGRLPLVQVGQPRSHVVAGAASVPSRPGELGPDLPREQPGGDGGARVDPDRADAGRRIRQLAAVDLDPRGLQLQQYGVARVTVPAQLRLSSSALRSSAGVRPPAEISATVAAASARRAGTGLSWLRKCRAARRATTRARAGSSRSNVQASVSSHSAWKVRSRREP